MAMPTTLASGANRAISGSSTSMACSCWWAAASISRPGMAWHRRRARMKSDAMLTPGRAQVWCGATAHSMPWPVWLGTDHDDCLGNVRSA